MTITDTTSETPPIRRFPERPRPKQLTARPKAARPCAWRAIQRAEHRLAGLTMAASSASRRAI